MSFERNRFAGSKFSEEEQEELNDDFERANLSEEQLDKVEEVLVLLKKSGNFGSFIEDDEYYDPVYDRIFNTAQETWPLFELMHAILKSQTVPLTKDHIDTLYDIEFREGISFLRKVNLNSLENQITLFRGVNSIGKQNMDEAPDTFEVLEKIFNVDASLVTQKTFDNIFSSSTGLSMDTEVYWERIESLAECVVDLKEDGLLDTPLKDQNLEALFKFNFVTLMLQHTFSKQGIFYGDPGQVNFTKLMRVNDNADKLFQGVMMMQNNTSLANDPKMIERYKDVLDQIRAKTDELIDLGVLTNDEESLSAAQKNQELFDSCISLVANVTLKAEAKIGAAMFQQAARGKSGLGALPDNITTAVLGMFAPGSQRGANALKREADQAHKNASDKSDNKPKFK